MLPPAQVRRQLFPQAVTSTSSQHSATSEPPAKKPRLLKRIPDEIGKLIARDSTMLKQHHTLLDLFRKRQGRGDFASLENIRSHAAHHLNSQLKKHGAPVVLTTPPWSSLQNDAAVQRGPHHSATEHLEFLRTEGGCRKTWFSRSHSVMKNQKDKFSGVRSPVISFPLFAQL